MQRISHANVQNQPAQPQTNTQQPHSFLGALSGICLQVGRGALSLLNYLNPIHSSVVRSLVIWVSTMRQGTMRQPPEAEVLPSVSPVHQLSRRSVDQASVGEASITAAPDPLVFPALNNIHALNPSAKKEAILALSDQLLAAIDGYCEEENSAQGFNQLKEIIQHHKEQCQKLSVAFLSKEAEKPSTESLLIKEPSAAFLFTKELDQTVEVFSSVAETLNRYHQIKHPHLSETERQNNISLWVGQEKNLSEVQSSRAFNYTAQRPKILRQIHQNWNDFNHWSSGFGVMQKIFSGMIHAHSDYVHARHAEYMQSALKLLNQGALNVDANLTTKADARLTGSLDKIKSILQDKNWESVALLDNHGKTAFSAVQALLEGENSSITNLHQLSHQLRIVNKVLSQFSPQCLPSTHSYLNYWMHHTFQVYGQGKKPLFTLADGAALKNLVEPLLASVDQIASFSHDVGSLSHSLGLSSQKTWNVDSFQKLFQVVHDLKPMHSSMDALGYLLAPCTSHATHLQHNLQQLHRMGQATDHALSACKEAVLALGCANLESIHAKEALDTADQQFQFLNAFHKKDNVYQDASQVVMISQSNNDAAAMMEDKLGTETAAPMDVCYQNSTKGAIKNDLLDTQVLTQHGGMSALDANAVEIASEPNKTQRAALLKQRQTETEFFQQKTLGEALNLCVATKTALLNTAFVPFLENDAIWVPFTEMFNQCREFSSLPAYPLGEIEHLGIVESEIKQRVIDGDFDQAFQSLNCIPETNTEIKNNKISIAREMLRLAQLHVSNNVTGYIARAVREGREPTAVEREVVLAHLQSYKEARDAFASIQGVGVESDRDLSSFNKITHELAVGLEKPELMINQVFYHLKTPIESVHAMSGQLLPKMCAATESTLKISCDNYHFTSGNRKLYIGKNEEGKNILSIRDLNTGNCIFSSVPGKSFIQAGFHKNLVKENHGSFDVLENAVRHNLDQRIHEIVQVGNTITITGTVVGDIKGGIDTSEQKNIIPYELNIYFNEKDQINMSCRVLSGANFIHLIYGSSESEKIYGLGEQYTYLNQKGHEVPILVQEQGIGSGHPYITPVLNFLAGAGGTPYTTYVSIPHYITHEGLSFEVKNAEYAVFNFKEKDSNTLRIFSDQFEITLIQKNSVMEAIEARAPSFNHSPKLPDWVNKGAIIGIQGGTSRALEVLTDLEKRKTPIAALWLQDWVGKRKNLIGEQLWWNWELDKKHYPHWDELVATCRSKDIRLMGYINPYLVKLDQKAHVERDLFSEAKAYGYLVKKENGDLYPLEITTFSSYMLDLSNPKAREWMKDIIKTQMIDKGLSGWMADFGEGLPMDAVLYSGDAKSFHNHYPEEWAKLNLEAIREAGKEDEITFFARSGFTRSPESVPLLWTGDQIHTDDEFDGMKAALRAINGSGFSGFKRNHSDIGGYTTVVLPFTNLGWVRTEDLLFRWMAMNAFTCAFRTHEGLQPKINAQFYSNERCYDMFDHFAKIYESLAFYRQQLEQEAQSFGHPITRHPVLHYPHDAVIADLKDQFMLGDEIMVAPVFNQKDFKKGHSVYLPEGTWVSPWINSVDGLQPEYQHNNKGEWITVKSDYKHPPIFYKKGSLVGAQFIKNLEAYGINRVITLNE